MVSENVLRKIPQIIYIYSVLLALIINDSNLLAVGLISHFITELP